MMDYETLKAKQDEIRAKREKLLAECKMYEEDISKIQTRLRGSCVPKGFENFGFV
jgi:septal ring factor EnvC (AmiA/AmiB activator)